MPPNVCATSGSSARAGRDATRPHLHLALDVVDEDVVGGPDRLRVRHAHGPRDGLRAPDQPRDVLRQQPALWTVRLHDEGASPHAGTPHLFPGFLCQFLLLCPNPVEFSLVQLFEIKHGILGTFHSSN